MIKGELLSIPTGPFAGQLGEVEEIREKVVILKVGNLKVEQDRKILEAVMISEEEGDGRREKIRIRTKEKGKDEGEGEERENKKQKTRARQEQTPPTPTPANQNTEQKEEKEKMERTTTQTQTQTQTPTGPARIEPLYCPVCPDDRPKTRRRPTDLVCGDCYRLYTNEAAIALARGSVINIFDWVVKRAPETLTALEEQYTAAKAEVETLQQVVREEVYQNLKRTTGGRQVPREVWNQAFRTQQGNLWRNKGGNAKFARMKGLEGRIALLKGILEKANEPKPAVPANKPAAEVTTAEEVTNTDPQPVKTAAKPRKPRTLKAKKTETK